MLHGRRPDDSRSNQPDKNRWLNPFNPVILGATRCNHDVKFIPSFSDSLALMFYITVPSISHSISSSRRTVNITTFSTDIDRHTDSFTPTLIDTWIVQAYITKGELKNSTALPLLASALYSLEASNPATNVNGRDEAVERLRKMLLKCVNKLEHFSERSGPWCVRFLQGKRNHHTNRQFQALCWGNALRTVRKEVEVAVAQESKIDDGSDMCEDDELPIVDGSRVVVMGPDGNLGLVSDYLDYARRPTHSDTDPLSMYLFFSSWLKTSISLKSRHKIRVMPGYSGPQVAGQEDENPTETVCPPHPQSNTHGYVHRPGTVPALYGPKVQMRPGDRDSSEDREKYAAMILVLFKPWRTPQNLRGGSDTWWDALLEWERGLWQIAGRDDTEQETLRARRTVQLIGNLQAMARAQSEAAAISKKRLADAMQAASLNPKWQLPRRYHPVNPDDDLPLNADDYVQLMQMFKQENKLPPDLQEAVKRVTRLNMMHTRPTPGAQGVVRLASSSEAQRLDDKLQRLELDEQRKGQIVEEKKGDEHTVPQKNPALPHDPATFDVNELGPKPYTLDAISKHLNLHWRQRLAMEIVAAQLFKEMCKDGQESGNEICGVDRPLLFAESPDQLLLHVAGCAGTGKSRVLDAMRLLFDGYDRAHWLEIGAFTGTAAANVNGRTLHALTGLNLGEDGQRMYGQKIWRNVRFLAIDEVSMLGCKLLGNVSTAMAKAKGTSEAVMGGVHTIFIGDQAQACVCVCGVCGVCEQKRACTRARVRPLVRASA
jgi:hypothetical protein